MKFAAALLAATAQASFRQEFMKYLAEHGKSYLTQAEFEAREQLFANAHALIQQHNST